MKDEIEFTITFNGGLKFLRIKEDISEDILSILREVIGNSEEFNNLCIFFNDGKFLGPEIIYNKPLCG